MARRLLFLDFDGVLNHRAHLASVPAGFADDAEHLDPTCVERLDRVVSATDASIVVSSSWRLLFPLSELRRCLAARGLREADRRVVAVTANLFRVEHRRGREILDHLQSRDDVESYAVVDDEVGDILPVVSKDRVVETSFDAGGMTERHARELERVLMWPLEGAPR